MACPARCPAAASWVDGVRQGRALKRLTKRQTHSVGWQPTVPASQTPPQRSWSCMSGCRGWQVAVAHTKSNCWGHGRHPRRPHRGYGRCEPCRHRGGSTWQKHAPVLGVTVASCGDLIVCHYSPHVLPPPAHGCPLENDGAAGAPGVDTPRSSTSRPGTAARSSARGKAATTARAGHGRDLLLSGNPARSTSHKTPQTRRHVLCVLGEVTFRNVFEMIPVPASSPPQPQLTTAGCVFPQCVPVAAPCQCRHSGALAALHAEARCCTEPDTRPSAGRHRTVTARELAAPPPCA